VELQDRDPPKSYTLAGQGEGGVAGFARGSARVTLLQEQDGECRPSYQVEANVGGKIAQLGARLIDGVAKKTADQFFSRILRPL
jgi:carbon monoxide dehydrogenase subunit G